MYARPFALIVLLLAAARAGAQSPPATTDSAKHAAEGWIYGASLGIPERRDLPEGGGDGQRIRRREYDSTAQQSSKCVQGVQGDRLRDDPDIEKCTTLLVRG